MTINNSFIYGVLFDPLVAQTNTQVLEVLYDALFDNEITYQANFDNQILYSGIFLEG